MVRNQPVIWSAATCEFPRAGVYVGLAQHHEHLVVARSLNPRQMRMFVGGHMHIHGEDVPWPMVYYAVRDPSAVRVIPVEQRPLAAGFRPVHLHFRFHAACRASVLIAADPPPTTPGGFLVSIGLRADLEHGLFESTIDSEPPQGWDDLFNRLRTAAATNGSRRQRDPPHAGLT